MDSSECELQILRLLGLLQLLRLLRLSLLGTEVTTLDAWQLTFSPTDSALRLKLFFIIVIGRTLSKTVTWTGVGSIDKSFGLIFGVFKGYVVTVCLFSILNWFYPYQNWGISAEDAMSFNVIKKGSEVLIEEFPSNEDFIDTKEKIEKI